MVKITRKFECGPSCYRFGKTHCPLYKDQNCWAYAPPLPTVSWTQADIDNYMKEELKKEQP